MSDNFRFAQLQPFTLAGAGAIIGATTITLNSMTDIDGGSLTMATDFGSIGYGTLEPGSGDQEEQISFTGLTNNANGTTTLTGVKNVDFMYPYTETSGLVKTHPGGVRFVISNTSGFYNKLTSKDDDETITGLWDFPSGANNPTIGNVTYVAPTGDTQIATKKYVDDVAVAGAPDANTTTKGIVQLPTQAQVDARTATGSTSASLTPTPANLRTVLTHDLVASATGTDAYAITITPVITAYSQGQVFRFKADVANTGACTLNVSGVGAVALKVYGADPRTNYITANSVVECVYNSTGPVMNIISVSSQSQISQDGAEIYAASASGNDTYAVTYVPAPTAYVTGAMYNFKTDVANTGAATLNVNALGAKTIKKFANGTAVDLSTGDIAAGQMVQCMYDGTDMIMTSASQPRPLYASGQTSRAAATGTGTQNIAHGLGVVPRLVKITAVANDFLNNDSVAYSFGSGTSTSTETCTYQNAAGISGQNNAAIITLPNANAGETVTATLSALDATNITLDFTSLQLNAGSMYLQWEAWA